MHYSAAKSPRRPLLHRARLVSLRRLLPLAAAAGLALFVLLRLVLLLASEEAPAKQRRAKNAPFKPQTLLVLGYVRISPCFLFILTYSC